jgi:hypothetical protein
MFRVPRERLAASTNANGLFLLALAATAFDFGFLQRRFVAQGFATFDAASLFFQDDRIGERLDPMSMRQRP